MARGAIGGRSGFRKSFGSGFDACAVSAVAPPSACCRRSAFPLSATAPSLSRSCLDAVLHEGVGLNAWCERHGWTDRHTAGSWVRQLSATAGLLATHGAEPLPRFFRLCRGFLRLSPIFLWLDHGFAVPAARFFRLSAWLPGRSRCPGWSSPELKRCQQRLCLSRYGCVFSCSSARV